ncbi:Ppx/GppA family phosphatase [Kordiimonas aquimaris]|uniref:Ppx/GppA family phosphatase n=1 Tax=Kordiimonas aquimaris TaxID=707591 RepID=UPI0021D23A37|nr:Ppx/GppA family phosphatase [Kordiimonas aquimaris]
MFDVSGHSERYVAVIDIGSNSVRLVVFSGRSRVPATVFNEKLMCGLGAEVGRSGLMDKNAIALAVSTLKRFKALCDQMQVTDTLVVATAAVRDATNGGEFVDLIRRETGFEISVIEGSEEARLAGLGVLSSDPDASGIVGDLGGGSLELAQVHKGEVLQTISLPLGPLRLMSKFGNKSRSIRKFLRAQFTAIDWLGEIDDQNLYMVGGAWRNIAKLMMSEKSNPLPILQGYKSNRNELSSYCKRLSNLDPQNIPFASDIPVKRVEVLPTAAIVLSELLNATRAKNGIVSAYGLREGLIFDQLTVSEKKFDPFIHACRVLADERCRFAEHADVIYDWTRSLFKKEARKPKQQRKLHYAICLLSDIAWRGHPDFRAEKAVETILHGNFVGISHVERAYIAVALNQAYGAPIDAPHISHILNLLKIREIIEARMMGAALRLAQRLSGGTVTALMVTQLRVTRNKLWLGVPQSYRDIANEVVAKRLSHLAQLMGRKSVIEFPDDLNDISVG